MDQAHEDVADARAVLGLVEPGVARRAWGGFWAIAPSAIGFAIQAVTRAADMPTTMDARLAAQAETERRLARRLDEIKQELGDNRMLLNEILRNDKPQVPFSPGLAGEQSEKVAR